jgi:hypothetical protein
MPRNPLAILACSAVLVGTPLLASNAVGQTLKAEPIFFADPVPGRNVANGQLELGRTTLSGALHMFAEVLSGDSVRVPRLHQANPSTLTEGSDWELGADTVRPRYRLDLGPERYVLYFDANRRLVATITSRPPLPVRRPELATHYATLRLQRRWHSGDVPSLDAMVAPLGPCLWCTTNVQVSDDLVTAFGYVYTCETAPTLAASKK